MSRRRTTPLHLAALRAVGALALLALGTPACASILGDDFEVTDHGGGSSGGSACLDQGCDSCTFCVLAEACAGVDQKCYENPDCSFIDGCVFGCNNGDQACIDACGQQYPGGVDDFNARAACIQCECSSVCGTSC